VGGKKETPKDAKKSTTPGQEYSKQKAAPEGGWTKRRKKRLRAPLGKSGVVADHLADVPLSDLH